MRWVPAIVVVASLYASAAGADEGAGAIKGAVTDKATGAALGGVSVTAVSREVTITVRTGDDGRYTFDELAPGRYTLLFVYGKTRLQRDGVDVALGATTTVDVALDAARSSQVITIREKPAVSKAAPPAPLEKYGSTPPPYSDEAINGDYWSRAWLLLDLDVKGRVTAVKLLKRAGHELDEIAVREARKYRFTPARDDEGRAIPSRVVVMMEWPSYWYARTLISTGVPPCAGSGPMRLGSMHPSYRDCSVVEIPEGATFVPPADPPVQFNPLW